jgi:hypothetical protein
MGYDRQSDWPGDFLCRRNIVRTSSGGRPCWRCLRRHLFGIGLTKLDRHHPELLVPRDRIEIDGLLPGGRFVGRRHSTERDCGSLAED